MTSCGLVHLHFDTKPCKFTFDLNIMTSCGLVHLYFDTKPCKFTFDLNIMTSCGLVHLHFDTKPCKFTFDLNIMTSCGLVHLRFDTKPCKFAFDLTSWHLVVLNICTSTLRRVVTVARQFFKALPTWNHSNDLEIKKQPGFSTGAAFEWPWHECPRAWQESHSRIVEHFGRVDIPGGAKMSAMPVQDTWLREEKSLGNGDMISCVIIWRWQSD